MNITNQEIINRFESFIKSISKNDKIAIIHDSDPDGICSAVIISKAIEKIREKKIDLRINQSINEHGLNIKTVEILKKNNINKVISTDLSLEEIPEMLKELEKFADVLIIDHHPILSTNYTQRVFIFKPQLFCEGIEPPKYCSSKLVYDMCLRVVDISDLDWISAVGVIADIATMAWPEFMTQVFKKYNINKKKDWFNSKLGRIAEYIVSTQSYDLSKIQEAFDAVYNAKNPDDIIKSGLKEYYKIVDAEIKDWVKNVNKRAEIYKNIDLIIYEIKSKYKIKSPISTIISFKYPNKTLITVDIDGDNVGVSARRQDRKIKTNEMILYAIKGLKEAYGGGHPPASGARLKKEHYEIFKNKIIEYLRDNKVQ